MKNKKAIISLSLALTIICGTSSIYSAKAAGAVLDITKAQAVETATENSSKIAKVNTAIDTVNRNIVKYNELSDEIDDLEENLDKYRSSYEELNSTENKMKYEQLKSIKASYLQADAIPDEATRNATISYIYSKCGYTEAQIDALLQSISGNIAKLHAAGLKLKEAGLVDENLAPKNLTAQKYYDTFQYSKIMPPIIAQDMLDKANLQKSVIESAIDVKVKEAYDTILYAEDGLALTQKLYDTQFKEYNQLLSKYQLGLCSVVEKNVAEIGIKKLQLQLDSLKRQVENGKIQFNQALGVDSETQYNFVDEKLSYSAPLSYSEYLSSAIANRAEILAAKITIDEKQENFDLASKYFTETDLTYIKAKLELSKAKSDYGDVSKNIEMEIQKSYLDVKQKQSAKQLADMKLKQANNQYNTAKISYFEGVIDLSLLWNAELGVNQAEMNDNKALRDYNNAFYELKQNCKTGTEYIMEGA